VDTRISTAPILLEHRGTSITHQTVPTLGTLKGRIPKHLSPAHLASGTAMMVNLTVKFLLPSRTGWQRGLISRTPATSRANRRHRCLRGKRPTRNPSPRRTAAMFRSPPAREVISRKRQLWLVTFAEAGSSSEWRVEHEGDRNRKLTNDRLPSGVMLSDRPVDTAPSVLSTVPTTLRSADVDRERERRSSSRSSRLGPTVTRTIRTIPRTVPAGSASLAIPVAIRRMAANPTRSDCIPARI